MRAAGHLVAGLNAAAAALLAALAGVLLWLAPLVSWDVRLPLAVYGLFPVGLLAIAFALGRRAARHLAGRSFPAGRSALSALISLFFIAWPLTSFPVLEKYYFEPSGVVSLEALHREGWEGFDARAWSADQAAFRARLQGAWGAFPPPVPAAARLRSTTREDGYARHELELSVEASGIPAWDRMPFYLLVPDRPRAQPAPALIVYHQHNGRFEKGKEEPAGVFGDPRQAIAVDLVRRGYVVACPDALGFSERREHGEAWTAMKLLLYGRTLNGKYAWDVSRLVDYLETRPEVDPGRIGIAGHSLGGQMAIFAALYDPRLGVVVSSCGFSRLAGEPGQLGTGHVYAYATYLPGLLAGEPPMDMRELLGLLRGRHLFLASGLRDDIFPIDGAAEIHAWLEQMYAHDGISERLQTLRHSGAHGLPRHVKREAYAFLERVWPQARGTDAPGASAARPGGRPQR